MTYLYPASSLVAFFIKVGANGEKRPEQPQIQSEIEGYADLFIGATYRGWQSRTGIYAMVAGLNNTSFFISEDAIDNLGGCLFKI
jgi:hypothetical protein